MVFKFLSKLKQKQTSVVTRFAPSPTGFLHVGTYRTAVFSYLYARKNGGRFVLRIEDTDKGRSKKEYEENIIESLKWLSLEYDEMYRQSEQAPFHRKLLEKLIKEDKAFVSKEKPLKEGDREEVIRFRNPNKKVKFHDIIRGDIEFDTSELGDFIIAKSLNEPVFHFAVVADDWNSHITHVIRGEDHISNTPRQILIQEALGAPTPMYAHLPLVLAVDKSKLSKRKGALAVTEYRDRGYLPEALLNFMVLIGWNPGDDREMFTKEELEKEFSLERVQKSSAVFNEEKLNHINKEYLKLVPMDKKIGELSLRLSKSKKFDSVKDGLLERLAPVIFERIEKYGDIDLLITNGDLDYYFSNPDYDPEKLFWKEEKNWKILKGHFLYLRSAMTSLAEYPDPESIRNVIWKYAEEKGKGSVLWPLRYSLSGRDKSPDPMALISILGATESLKRMDYALKKIDTKIS